MDFYLVILFDTVQYEQSVAPLSAHWKLISGKTVECSRLFLIAETKAGRCGDVFNIKTSKKLNFVLSWGKNSSSTYINNGLIMLLITTSFSNISVNKNLLQKPSGFICWCSSIQRFFNLEFWKNSRVVFVEKPSFWRYCRSLSTF